MKITYSTKTCLEEQAGFGIISLGMANIITGGAFPLLQEIYTKASLPYTVIIFMLTTFVLLFIFLPILFSIRIKDCNKIITFEERIE